MQKTRIAFLFKQFSRQLWVQAASFAILGVALVPLAHWLGPVLPNGLERLTGANSVESILDILATSMLAVTTFSLSIMVSAYSAATASVTPRAVLLLLQDRTSQTVLSTFIGAFLFSIVGMIALEAGAFSRSGVVVLFFATVCVIALVVVALIRWIQHLTTFGRVDDTTKRVEVATTNALRARASQPALGGIPAERLSRETGGQQVRASKTGYLCHVDMPKLMAVAKELAGESARPQVQLALLPGAFVHTATVLATVPPQATSDHLSAILEAFTVDEKRTFDQDPRFGLCVLAEIAERALSPAVNDPGTAIDVLGRVVRILSAWTEQPPNEPEFPLIAVPTLKVSDLFDDVFPPIAHDGAAKLSVQLRLQKALLALAEVSPGDFGAACATHSARALEEAKRGNLTDADLARVQDVASKIRLAADAPCRPPHPL